MAEIEINEQFRHALDVMETSNRSIFVTGKAGTGKSTLLAHFCRNTTKRPVILAPTGVAALNVRGQTIHSFFNFYVDVTPQKIRTHKIKPRTPKLFKSLQTIIIDEVSMVRADLLDCVDVFLQEYGPQRGRRFGGVQMIFVGDLYQLPPVVTSGEREIFTTVYKSPFFFSAPAIEEMNLEIIELEKVYRQKDAGFIALLNKIRNNSVEDDDIAELNRRVVRAGVPPQSALAIHLTTTNQKADEINAACLAGLKAKQHRALAEIEGEFSAEYYPTATDLTFKVGAQVMMLNNDSKGRWVNGSIGVIKAVKEDDEGEKFVRVALEEGCVDVYPYAWSVYRTRIEDGQLVSEPVGTFTQFPFRLAWAITIHKSQGKTFDSVSIDLGRGTFAAGQAYVAFSRCTSFEGIVLQQPVTKGNIRADWRIYAFLTARHYKASEAAMPCEDKVALITQAIRDKRQLEIVYLKANDTKSKRIVRPLSVGTETYRDKEFTGMQAFCMLRHEERMFRVDRILDIKLAPA
jgi:ATP-dependent DNA helicase PIF1